MGPVHPDLPAVRMLQAHSLDRPPRRLSLRVLDVLGLDPLTAAHGAALLIVFAVTLVGGFSVDAWPMALPFLGLIATQVCLATVGATWSTEPLLVRGGRLVWQMLALYLLLLVFDSIWGRRHTVMLWYLPLVMTPFVLASWLPAWVLRWFRWRLANVAEPRQAVSQQTTPRRMQFGLADAWRWCTLLCILLAVMVGFRNELDGFDGLGYAILLYLAVLASVPAGLVASLLLWLALGQRWTMPRRIVAGLLVLAWLVVSCLAAWYASDTREDDGDSWVGVWILADVACVATLVTAQALRRRGWRVVR